MERIKKILYKGKEIVFVDYSNIKNEDEMIALHYAHIDFSIRENKQYLYCGDYTGTYTTPKYVKAVNKSLGEVNFIKKGALLGMTGAKGIIVATVISIFKKNLKTFNDKNEAFEWLIS